jgi:TRAP-type C4-dicarboxylate transport system permease small subunit
MHFLKSIERLIVYVSKFVMIVSLTAMIAIGFIQVILRNFFDTGFMWADIVVRNLVLWVGFSGAVVATAKGRNIAIGALIRFIPEAGRRATHVIVSLVAAIVCLFLSHASVKFIIMEKEMGGVLVGKFPLWISELIIPITFIFLSYQFLVHIFAPPVPHEREGV